jgi:hypothetical protein
MRHREDGPAIIFADGLKSWYINGIRHRDDGPAIEIPDGSKQWFISDTRFTEEEFITKIKNKKFTASEIASLKSYGIEVG